MVDILGTLEAFLQYVRGRANAQVMVTNYSSVMKKRNTIMYVVLIDNSLIQHKNRDERCFMGKGQ